MTPARYRKILDQMGLTQVRASELLGVSPRQGRRWALGEAEIPRAVEIVLEEAVEPGYLARAMGLSTGHVAVPIVRGEMSHSTSAPGTKSEKLIDGKVILRPRDDGSFDELLLMDGKKCVVHAEMMDDGLLWIGIYPRGEKKQRSAVMWIRANRSKLHVKAEEE